MLVLARRIQSYREKMLLVVNQDIVSINPSPFYVINIIEYNILINCLNKLEVAYIWK